MPVYNDTKRVRAEIDVSAAKHNFMSVKAAIGSDTKLCCVVKANAYGHGAIEFSRLLESLGADWFAVSNIDEALQLRDAGIQKPVLILGYTPVEYAPELARRNITQCVYSYNYGRALSDCASDAGTPVKIHIKIDTGMGRIGFHCDGSPECATSFDEMLRACRLPGLIPEGIFTHFAVSDEGGDGRAFTELQFSRFMKAIEYLEKSGVHLPLRHCANSAAIFDYPEYQLDMVRAGISLYGLQPSGKLVNKPELKPVMSLKSTVTYIKTVCPGGSVSYGREYTATSPVKIATVPVGYADGFFRSNSAAGTRVLIKNRLFPIAGRICMDQLMLDISSAPDIEEGDEVTLFGTSPAYTADDIARNTGTVNYEVICAVGERVPRVYINKN